MGHPINSLSSSSHLDIMKSLIFAALIFGAAVVATGTAPLPPPPPPPAPPAAPLHYRPPVHYRPRYGPPSHGGGLEGILPLLLLGKNGGHGSGIKSLLPLLLLGGGLGGKGGKGGLGGNPLLPPLLLGKNCKDPHDCVKPNTHNTLCGDKAPYKKCCVCSGGLF